MSIVSISIVAILIIVGFMVIALESNLPQQTKSRVLIGMVLMIGGAVAVFLSNDADGKIDWGDRLEGNKADDGGQQKKAAKKPGDDGGQPEEAPSRAGEGEKDEGADDGGDKNKGKDEGKDEGKSSNKGEKKDAKKTVISTFQDCDYCPLMTIVKGGRFFMGSSLKSVYRIANEQPQQRLFVGAKFAVSQTEITIRLFTKFTRETGYSPSNGCVVNGLMDASANYLNPGFVQEDLDPVVCVSWHDAKAYVRWLSKKTGSKYRLLTEAEWEYMARAGTTTTFWTKNAVSISEANFGRTWRGTKPVGSYGPNPFGLKDVYGNVAEWVEDCWHNTLKGRSDHPVAWLEKNGGDCKVRVIRGGGWDSAVVDLRSAARSYEGMKNFSNTVGLRVAKDL